MKHDETVELIDMCNSQKDMPNTFLYAVRRVIELSIVLNTNIQLRYKQVLLKNEMAKCFWR